MTEQAVYEIETVGPHFKICVLCYDDSVHLFACQGVGDSA